MAVVFSCQEGMNSLRENFCLGTSALGEDKGDAVTGWKMPNSVGLDLVGEGWHMDGGGTGVGQGRQPWS